MDYRTVDHVSGPLKAQYEKVKGKNVWHLKPKFVVHVTDEAGKTYYLPTFGRKGRVSRLPTASATKRAEDFLRTNVEGSGEKFAKYLGSVKEKINEKYISDPKLHQETNKHDYGSVKRRLQGSGGAPSATPPSGRRQLRSITGPDGQKITHAQLSAMTRVELIQLMNDMGEMQYEGEDGPSDMDYVDSILKLKEGEEEGKEGESGYVTPEGKGGGGSYHSSGPGHKAAYDLRLQAGGGMELQFDDPEPVFEEYVPTHMHKKGWEYHTKHGKKHYNVNKIQEMISQGRTADVDKILNYQKHAPQKAELQKLIDDYRAFLEDHQRWAANPGRDPALTEQQRLQFQGEDQQQKALKQKQADQAAAEAQKQSLQQIQALQQQAPVAPPGAPPAATAQAASVMDISELVHKAERIQGYFTGPDKAVPSREIQVKLNDLQGKMTTVKSDQNNQAAVGELNTLVNELVSQQSLENLDKSLAPELQQQEAQANQEVDQSADDVAKKTEELKKKKIDLSKESLNVEKARKEVIAEVDPHIETNKTTRYKADIMAIRRARRARYKRVRLPNAGYLTYNCTEDPDADHSDIFS